VSIIYKKSKDGTIVPSLLLLKSLIMKNITLTIFILALHFSYMPGQKLSIGLGFEVNQTRFRQNAPNIEALFSNPHKAGFGISAHGSASLKICKKWIIHLKPGLSILRTNSSITSSKNASFTNLSFDIGYYLGKKVHLNTGIEYSYLVRLISTFQGRSGDFTFFANNRHFINPTASISYDIDRNLCVHLRFIYFLKDLFNSGALDNDGNVVGPVMVYPYTIGIGVTFNFEIFKPK